MPALALGGEAVIDASEIGVVFERWLDVTWPTWRARKKGQRCTDLHAAFMAGVMAWADPAGFAADLEQRRATLHREWEEASKQYRGV